MRSPQQSLFKDMANFLQKHREHLSLIFCASGICFSYWFYGFLQEKILSQSNLGATFILVLQTIANIFVAIIWQRVEAPPSSLPGGKTADGKGGEKLNHPLLALTSSTYVIAMAASNEALRFVSYPTAVLAKSCKLIPTMILGWAIEKRKYKIVQWISAFLISFGIAIFNLSRIKEQPTISHGGNGDEDVDEYWKGMVLLSISLCMDGFLGVSQGFVKRKDTRGNNERPPTAVETMLFINVYALLLLVPMAIADDQMNSGIQILQDDPILLRAIVILSAVVGIGQIFIFLTITWYSSLVCTTITTTRKFFTILFSVLHFGHHFSSWQWVSICMVFGGLYLSILPNNGKSKQEKVKASSEKIALKQD
jgi:UDP-galactose transporter B1